MRGGALGPNSGFPSDIPVNGWPKHNCWVSLLLMTVLSIWIQLNK